MALSRRRIFCGGDDRAASPKENATRDHLGRSDPERSCVSAADDQAAVEKVLAGDTSAFEDLVRRWQGPLLNLAYRFCRDRGRAQDMAQEAFLRAYRSLGHWRRESTFSTWLFALATNLYCSELRRIPVRTVALDEAPEPPDLRPSAGGLEEESRDRAVRRAVDSLPPKYREAVLLFYFHEMDIPSAARSLDLPEGTVKARLSRAREMLRRKLSSAQVGGHLRMEAL